MNPSSVSGKSKQKNSGNTNKHAKFEKIKREHHAYHTLIKPNSLLWNNNSPDYFQKIVIKISSANQIKS